jgi:putative transposase
VRLGFRAHHAKEIYVYAKSIVESARSGRKPILRRLTARIDKYDYKLDVIASSLFPCIPLGFSSGLGAFRATP